MECFEFIEDETKTGFYLFVDKTVVGEIFFRWRKEEAISIYHTIVIEEFQRKGYGKKLVNRVLEYAEENELNVSASCWFADKVIQSKTI